MALLEAAHGGKQFALVGLARLAMGAQRQITERLQALRQAFQAAPGLAGLELARARLRRPGQLRQRGIPGRMSDQER